MQLFDFWVDPEHVRFYHPKIIEAVLRHYGFSIENSYSQGTWGPFASASQQHGKKSTGSPIAFSHIIQNIRLLGRKAKDLLGISMVEIEADYMRKIRQIGREVVIVARKI